MNFQIRRLQGLIHLVVKPIMELLNPQRKGRLAIQEGERLIVIFIQHIVQYIVQIHDVNGEGQNYLAGGDMIKGGRADVMYRK